MDTAGSTQGWIRTTRVAAVAATAVAALFLAAGCGGDDDEDAPETLNLTSDTAGERFEVIDLGDKGASVGDIFVFDGPMVDPETDEVAGHSYGTQTALSIDGETTVVQAMITYELTDGDQILVGGTAEYPAEGDGLVEGEEYVRPILGGTGEYADAGGTMTTVRQSDGSYEQTFDFGDDE
jgi:hypothetical protein